MNFKYRLSLVIFGLFTAVFNVSAIGSNSEIFILDEDDTGGDLKLQFGTTLAEFLGWDDLSQKFYLSDSLQVDGDVILEGGVLQIKEVSVHPSADSGYGKIFTDNSDRVFFQTGGGDTKVLSYTSDLSAVWTLLPTNNFMGESTDLTGKLKTLTHNLTGDSTESFSVMNNHLFLLINNVITGGDIIITGTTVNEVDGTPTIADTETIVIDTSTNQYYQTNKKWIEVTSIDVGSGSISGIDYDAGIVGYTDVANNNFSINGYRIDAFSSGIDASFRMQMIKVQDDGNKKMSLVFMEDIGFDADSKGNQIIDYLRSGGNSRDYDPVGPTIWMSNDNLTWKQPDFMTYFSNDENKVEGLTKDEGIIIRFVDEDGGINTVDWISLQVFFNGSLE